MRRKRKKMIPGGPKLPSEDYDEGPRPKAKAKKKRVVGKYKPSRHSR